MEDKIGTLRRIYESRSTSDLPPALTGGFAPSPDTQEAIRPILDSRGQLEHEVIVAAPANQKPGNGNAARLEPAVISILTRPYSDAYQVRLLFLSISLAHSDRRFRK